MMGERGDGVTFFSPFWRHPLKEGSSMNTSIEPSPREEEGVKIQKCSSLFCSFSRFDVFLLLFCFFIFFHIF